MSFGKMGARGGFGSAGVLGGASTPNFSLIWTPAYLVWGGAYLTWS